MLIFKGMYVFHSHLLKYFKKNIPNFVHSLKKSIPITHLVGRHEYLEVDPAGKDRGNKCFREVFLNQETYGSLWDPENSKGVTGKSNINGGPGKRLIGQRGPPEGSYIEYMGLEDSLI